MDKIYLDEKGYQEYLKEIEDLKEKIAKNNRDISEYQSDDAYGDGWHDNFAYEQAIAKERSLMYELDRKMKGLNNIVIVENTNKDIVGINTRVEVKFDEEDENEIYYVTGSTSSNIDSDIPEITLNSPLGKALYKKKKNDKFTYKVDNMELNGIIVDIRSK